MTENNNHSSSEAVRTMQINRLLDERHRAKEELHDLKQLRRALESERRKLQQERMRLKDSYPVNASALAETKAELRAVRHERQKATDQLPAVRDRLAALDNEIAEFNRQNGTNYGVPCCFARNSAEVVEVEVVEPMQENGSKDYYDELNVFAEQRGIRNR